MENAFIWPDVQLLERSEEFLKNILIPKIKQPFEQIGMYTTLVWFGKTFRANPDYKNYGWRNWALANITPKVIKLPVHLVSILDLTFLSVNTSFQVNHYHIHGPGYYALVKSLCCPLRKKDNAHSQSYLMKWGQKRLYQSQSQQTINQKRNNVASNRIQVGKELDPQLDLIHVKKIIDLIVAVPDLNVEYPHLYVFMVPQHEWVDLFLEATT